MRIGTWNILSGQSVESDSAPSLTDAIARLDLDVLGLNEIETHWERSGFAHQPADAARGMGAVDWRFAPSFTGSDAARRPTRGMLLGPSDETRGAHYGIALLSRIPVVRWHRKELGRSLVGLPLLNARNGAREMRYVRDEPHVAIAAELANGWTAIATHLSFVLPFSIAQWLTVRRWAERFGERVIVAGDFNLPRQLTPTGRTWKSAVAMPTFPAWRPRVQFDQVLVRRSVETQQLSLPTTGISDHLPIGIEIG